MTARKKKRVAVIGARGYSGLELTRLLLRHEEVGELICFAQDRLFELADYLPEAMARAIKVEPLASLEAFLPELDTVFLATPAEASLALAPRVMECHESRASVIDLSGAFRFQEGGEAERAARFQQWYKLAHPAPAWAGKASYGLVPFAAPGAGRALVANPGCYATAVLLALVPLLRANAVDPASLVVDAKSGTSGAGRKAVESQLFTEVEGECLPYRVGQHQHLPEIREWARAFSGVAVDPFFATQLLPVRRGIQAAVYARLRPGVGADDVSAAFSAAYSSYPLARVTRLDASGEQGLRPSLALSLKRVVGSARVHLAFQVMEEKLYLFSFIDNLLKGAASQAVENFNQLHDLPAAFGLEGMEGTL